MWFIEGDFIALPPNVEPVAKIAYIGIAAAYVFSHALRIYRREPLNLPLVAGVALLAESHISVHTWPEFQYAAVDVFMCGAAANPEAALKILATGMQASHVRVEKLRRDSQRRDGACWSARTREVPKPRPDLPEKCPESLFSCPVSAIFVLENRFPITQAPLFDEGERSTPSQSNFMA